MVDSGISMGELLDMVAKRHSREDAILLELCIDGILWRESDNVIAQYSRISRKIISKLRKQVKSEFSHDNFTI